MKMLTNDNSSKHLKERIGFQVKIAKRNWVWFWNVLFAYLEMFFSNIWHKLSNTSTVPNLEVRGKFLFQELALTEIYSELRRHSNKLLMVVESRQPKYRRMRALNLIISEFDAVTWWFLLFFLTYTDNREWSANLYWRKAMKIISTSPSISFEFVLFFEACESYFGIKLAIL